MNAAISSLLSEVKSGYTSPPFDELEKLIEIFIKAIGELLDSEDPEVIAEIASLIQKIIEAKNEFIVEKVLKESPEGGTPFTRAIEKGREEEKVERPMLPRAQVKRATTSMDKD